MIKRILNNHYLNKFFGKQNLFIERAEKTSDKVLEYLREHDVKRCFCVAPEKGEYVEKYANLYSEIKKREDIEIVMHVHLKDKDNELQVLSAIFFFANLGIYPDKIVFGWWREDEGTERICNKFKLKIIKQHYHIYDFWL
jgi:hypothetical protein